MTSLPIALHATTGNTSARTAEGVWADSHFYHYGLRASSNPPLERLRARVLKRPTACHLLLVEGDAEAAALVGEDRAATELSGEPGRKILEQRTVGRRPSAR